MEGPDEVERAPILHQVEQGIALDGYLMDVSVIEDALRTARCTFELVAEGQTDAVLVHEKDFASYDQLARRLVDLRRAGKGVSIRL